MNETITWIDVSIEKPDSDLTVMLFNGSEESFQVWMGHWTGEEWCYIDGGTATPSHWAEMPAGPVDAACRAASVGDSRRESRVGADCRAAPQSARA